jgi:CBS domain-containing protein
VNLHSNDLVGQAMRSPVVTVDPTMTLRAAAAVLRRNDIGAVAVVEHDKLVGVLSERDLVRALGDGVDTDRIAVAAVMARMPCSVDADSPLWAATMLMLRMGVRHLPVSENHRTVGMLSIRDALAVMERDRIIEPGSFMETVHDSSGAT